MSYVSVVLFDTTSRCPRIHHPSDLRGCLRPAGFTLSGRSYGEKMD